MESQSPNPKPTPTVFSTQKRVPWLFIGIGAAILLVIILIFLRLRHTLPSAQTPSAISNSLNTNSGTNPFSNINSNSNQASSGSGTLYNFAGSITNISGNNITITTMVGDPNLPPQQSAPKQVNATLVVSPNTQIFSLGSNQNYTLGDLKTGTFIQIFSNPNIDYTKPIQVQKIVIMTNTQPPTPTH